MLTTAELNAYKEHFLKIHHKSLHMYTKKCIDSVFFGCIVVKEKKNGNELEPAGGVNK